MATITANRTWIAFANSARCNHSDAIHELKYINWEMGSNFHFAIGDTVYLFISEERSIRFKMVVVEQDCSRTDATLLFQPENSSHLLNIPKVKSMKSERISPF